MTNGIFMKERYDEYAKPFKKVCEGIFRTYLTERDLEFNKVKVESIDLAGEFFEGRSAIVGVVDKKYRIKLIYNIETCGYSIKPADKETGRWLNYDEETEDFETTVESGNLEYVLFDTYKRILAQTQPSDEGIVEVQLNRENGKISVGTRVFCQYSEVLVSDDEIAKICKRNSINVRFTQQNIYFEFEI